MVCMCVCVELLVIAEVNCDGIPGIPTFFLVFSSKNRNSHRTAHHSLEAGPCMLLNSIFYQKMVRYAIKDTILTVVMIFLSTLSIYAAYRNV